LISEDIPLNQGCLKPIHVKIPKRSFLSPSPTAAVVGGNVLTSQRVTDVIFKAFQACAASQGDCNNLTFGFGGNQSGQDEVKGFGYYETIAGGSGAGSTWEGTSGVHTHMTNTRITDAEIFERRYPVILRQFGLREGSGGKGKHNGGDGVIRDIEFRIPVTVSILSERRVYHPYGLEGGGEGQCGLNTWVRKVTKPDKNSDATDDQSKFDEKDKKEGEEKRRAYGEEDATQWRYINLGGKNSSEMKAGERIIVQTPGGGAWGKAGDEKATLSEKDPKHAWRGGSIASRQGTAEASA
jgi:5-oxoprolinase (ATP-hydrolysing)